MSEKNFEELELDWEEQAKKRERLEYEQEENIRLEEEFDREWEEHERELRIAYDEDAINLPRS